MPLKHYYPLSVMVFIFILACRQNQTTQKITGGDTTVLSTVTDNTPYLQYIKSTVQFSITASDHSMELLKDIQLTNRDKKNVLVFVCTKYDCSTCINEQISNLLRLLKEQKFKQQLVIITDPYNVQHLTPTWGRVLKTVRVKERSLDIIQKIYQYNNHPLYYLLSPEKRLCLSAFVVNPGYSDVTDALLLSYSKNYL